MLPAEQDCTICNSTNIIQENTINRLQEALSFNHKRCSLYLFRGEKCANLALFHLEASFVIPLLCLWVMTP